MTPSAHAAQAPAMSPAGTMPRLSPIAHAGARRWQQLADPALRTAAAAWAGVAVLGQWLFAVYVVVFYGGNAVQGRPEAWNAVMPQGHVPGDLVGNLVVAVHLLFATVVIVGGGLQLVPRIRRDAPAFHRWNGRCYALSAMLASIGGLVIVWTRGGVGDLSQHLAISLNAVLIVGFAGLAWRDARARRLDAHRRWALRLFLAVSGVWFFRIGLMLWIVANRGPVGFDPESFTGPFLTILAFAQYLLPLAVLELYFRVQARRAPRGQIAMAAVLAVLTLAMGAGIAAAAAFMWLPHL